MQLRIHTLEVEAKFLLLCLLEPLLAFRPHLLQGLQGFPWLVVLPSYPQPHLVEVFPQEP